MDEREDHEVPHLAEELLEDDSCWERENHFSSGLWHTHTHQTEYVACIPMDGPKFKHGWTAQIELNGLEAKGKRLGEDRRHEAYWGEVRGENGRLMNVIKIHCMYVRNHQRTIRKCVFK